MSKQNASRFLFLAAACALLIAPRQVSAQSPYKVLDKWKIGGDGGWDYMTVDSGAHKLYLSRGPQVLVVDTTTGKQIGTITGLHGTHGIALDDSGKYGYITDGGTASAVVVFDRTSLATIATIPTGGQGPDAIVFEPVTKTVWAFEGRSKDAAVIDTTTLKVVANVAIPGRPEAATVDGKGLVYDNLEDKNAILRIDARTRTITANWPLTGCEGPSGIAIDGDGSRLFPVCDKHMAVVDTASGKTIANPTIGDGPDAAGFDPAHKLAFASCGEGVLSVVDAAQPGYPTVETLPTQHGARTMAYDAIADRVYTVTAELGPRPPATPENPRPRPPIVPGSFTVLVLGR